VFARAVDRAVVRFDADDQAFVEGEAEGVRQVGQGADVVGAEFDGHRT
jgi:hypothetical protein